MTRVKELKAILIGRNQEIKRLKKLLRQTREADHIVFNDYHRLVEDLKEKLSEVGRRKWYQFKRVE